MTLNWTEAQKALAWLDARLATDEAAQPHLDTIMVALAGEKRTPSAGGQPGGVEDGIELNVLLSPDRRRIELQCRSMRTFVELEKLIEGYTPGTSKQEAPEGARWRPTATDPAPEDGSPFWAYLFQTGVRELRWMSPAERAEAWGPGEDPADFDGLFVEVANTDEEWEPKWWLPLDALPPAPQAEGVE